MSTSHSLSRAVRSIEAAAFDQSQWKDVLNLLAETFRSTVFAMRTFNASPFSYVASDGGEEISSQYIAGRWDTFDIRAQRFTEAPPQRLVTDIDLVSAEEFQQHEFYRGFASRFDVTHLLAWRIELGGYSMAFASNRSQAMGPMTPEERAALEHLVTPASAAVLVASHIADARDAALLEALAASGAAALVLGPGCLVRAATPAAEQLFAPGFSAEDRRLVADNCSPEGALASLYRATSSRSPSPKRLDPFVIHCSDGKRILCLPLLLQGLGCDIFSGARALLVMRSLDATIAPDSIHLMRLFGLTAAQAAVASLLAQGHNASEIASKRRVSIETVRAMLKAAFAKTGARSQAELVALVYRATTGLAH